MSSLDMSKVVSATINNKSVVKITNQNGVVLWKKEDEPQVYTITTSVSNGTYSGDTSIEEGSTATITITANTNYSLPTSVSVSNASHTYNSSTGVISISNPLGNVSISASCIRKYTATFSGTNMTTYSITAKAGDEVSLTITANDGYCPPLKSLYSFSGISADDATLTWTGEQVATNYISFTMPSNDVSITGNRYLDGRKSDVSMTDFPYAEASGQYYSATSMKTDTYSDSWYIIYVEKTSSSNPAYYPTTLDISASVYVSTDYHSVKGTFTVPGGTSAVPKIYSGGTIVYYMIYLYEG